MARRKSKYNAQRGEAGGFISFYHCVLRSQTMQNISNGNQQVNNGQTNNKTSTRAPAYTQAIEQAHNELLNDLNKSERNYATVDNARTTTTSAID